MALHEIFLFSGAVGFGEDFVLVALLEVPQVEIAVVDVSFVGVEGVGHYQLNKYCNESIKSFLAAE